MRLLMMMMTATMKMSMASGSPMSEIKLNSLQWRWAHMTLASKRYLAEPHFTKEQARGARADLGWQPLWNVAVASAIVLRHKTINDSPCCLHTRWASLISPPPGACAHHALQLQQRLVLPDIVLPPGTSPSRQLCVGTCSSVTASTWSCRGLLPSSGARPLSARFLGGGWPPRSPPAANMKRSLFGGTSVSSAYHQCLVGPHARPAAALSQPTSCI